MVTNAAKAPAHADPTQPVTLPMQPGRSPFRRFLRNKLALTSLILILTFALVGLFADAIVPFTDHSQSSLLNAAPGSRDPELGNVHWMGTDDLGRDIFTRLLYGTRLSLVVGIAVDAMITILGVFIGLTSGYFGGMVDNLLMRLTDIMYAFPSLLFAMMLVATFGRSVTAILIALAAANWVTMARLVRGQVLQVKQMDYVLGAYSVGATAAGTMWRHIIPNILGTVIVLSTLIIPGVMTAEAALSFLGVGIDPSTPTLGKLINAGFANIFSHPSEVLFPTAALTVMTLAFTLVGDGIRDALDPRLS